MSFLYNKKVFLKNFKLLLTLILGNYKIIKNKEIKGGT